MRAHFSCSLDNAASFLESRSGKKINMVRIRIISVKIGVGWLGRAFFLGLFAEDIHQLILISKPTLKSRSRTLLSVQYMNQLKRELGVLKASYIQMAALVGAGEQKVPCHHPIE